MKSPCVDICKFEKATGLCIACFRTKAEDKQWKTLSEKKQRKILDARKDRKAQLKALKGKKD
ncbi:MAG: DUF1289 domain-containing protein [Asticcacaulis sp.]